MAGHHIGGSTHVSTNAPQVRIRAALVGAATAALLGLATAQSPSASALPPGEDCGTPINVIQGGPGNDQIPGTPGNDLIIGGGGDDQIHGGGGDDTIVGGVGDDTLKGGTGEDCVDGGAGGDDAEGGAGNDYVGGGDDNDWVGGNEGDDVVDGGEGDNDVKTEPRATTSTSASSADPSPGQTRLPPGRPAVASLSSRRLTEEYWDVPTRRTDRATCSRAAPAAERSPSPLPSLQTDPDLVISSGDNLA